jgi:metal-dependent hydrolase (beta-lactamase superfamily II)
MCPYFFMPMPISETGIRGARMIYESLRPSVFMTGREEHMADRIAEISENRIVVVIGGMHLPGLEKEIRSRMPDSRIETITLFDLI